MPGTENRSQLPPVTYAEATMRKISPNPIAPYNMLLGILAEKGLVRVGPSTDFVEIKHISPEGLEAFDRTMNDPRFRAIHFAVLGQSEVQFQYSLEQSPWRESEEIRGRLQSLFLLQRVQRLLQGSETIESGIHATSQIRLRDETVKKMIAESIGRVEKEGQELAKEFPPFTAQELRQLIAKVVDWVPEQ